MAELSFAALHVRGGGAQRILSRDDAARRGVALRSGAFDSVGRARRDRVGRAARRAHSRRRGRREAGGRERSRFGQNRHAHHRRTARGKG